MATATEPVTDDDIFAGADNFKKRGNWTEDRHEALKNVTMDDIWADIMRRQAEHPEELTIKPVTANAGLVGAKYGKH